MIYNNFFPKEKTNLPDKKAGPLEARTWTSEENKSSEKGWSVCQELKREQHWQTALPCAVGGVRVLRGSGILVLLLLLSCC